ncbi:MAG: protein translocase subunit SecF [Alphaproteobacteria bacterium]|nr:protein translocase subunit SecF [Alphaproteobacteria bacterium]
MPRLIHFFIKPTHINFIGVRRIAFVISLLMCIVSIVSISTKGLNLGIDFRGGVLMEVQADKTIDMKELRSKLEHLNVDLQPVGENGTEVLITALGKGSNEQEQMKVTKDVRSILGEEYSFRRVEMVGPRVGEELIHNCVLAVILAGVMITVYVWTRFEWEFALGTMLSLIHDIIIAVGLFSVFQLDFDMTIIAGIMTLAGFSVNDTIVSYDRMRENLSKYRKMPIEEMINKTTNEMLPRTLLTGMSTIIMLVIMLFLGGSVLQGFALMMLWGILVGTYSSIYIAMPVLLYLDIRKTMESHEVVNPFGNVE